MSQQSDEQNLPKNGVKRYAFFVLFGVSACVALTSLYMPRMIVWYFNPPMQTGFSCVEPIGWALDRLQRAQMIAVAVGVVAGLLLGYRFRKKQ